MESYIGMNCNCCGMIFTGNDAVIICPTCRKPHHVECWIGMQGCSTEGCPQRNPLLRKASSETANAGAGLSSEPGAAPSPEPPRKKRIRTPLIIVEALLLAVILFTGFSVSWSGERFSRIIQTGSVGCLIRHEWKDATCTEAKHCVRCGLEEGNVLPHLWEEATCTEPRHCSVCHMTEGAALGHTWIEATCTEAKHCSVCHMTEDAALGHTWIEATCKEAKHCSVCHVTEGTLQGHTWVKATCTEPKHCTVCGLTEGKAKGHHFRAATCTTSRRCTDCGKTEGSPLGHHYQDFVCTRCGKVSITPEQVPQVLKLLNPRYKINSVGGIETYITYRNGSSTKTIKYIDLTVEYYNAVGDIIENEIGGDDRITYRYTGPLGPGQTSEQCYWLDFYNSTFCGKWHVLRVSIEYMDGSKLNLDSSLAGYIQD